MLACITSEIFQLLKTASSLLHCNGFRKDGILIKILVMQKENSWQRSLQAVWNQTVNEGVAHSKNPRKCAYHVTFDLDLDLEHTLDARWPGVHLVQVWWRSGHLPARRSDLRKSLQTDRRTDDGRLAIVLAHSWNELKNDFSNRLLARTEQRFSMWHFLFSADSAHRRAKETVSLLHWWSSRLLHVES